MKNMIKSLNFRKYNRFKKEIPSFYYCIFNFKLLVMALIAGIVTPIYYIIESKEKISEINTNVKFERIEAKFEAKFEKIDSKFEKMFDLLTFNQKITEEKMKLLISEHEKKEKTENEEIIKTIFEKNDSHKSYIEDENIRLKKLLEKK
jgi:hypothetical protein